MASANIMTSSFLGILYFSLWNSHSLSFDPSGPFPFLYRILSARSPLIQTLDHSQYAGRTILITGGTSGCGLECVKALNRVKCHVILTARSQERGEEVKRKIQREDNDAEAKATISVVELDMSSFESVRSLPSRLENLVKQLDVVILNAGVYQPNFTLCPETGWEETIQVNFLATAALTLLLRPYLSRAESGCLLIISSEAHAWADLQHNSTKALLYQLNKSDGATYPSCQRYHISKLLLVLWASEISRRANWSNISVAAASPGFSRTSLIPYFNESLVAKALESVACCSSAHGASQYMYAVRDLARGQGKGGFWSYGKWRKPSTAVSSDNGQGIRKTIYQDVVDILQNAGVIDQME